MLLLTERDDCSPCSDRQAGTQPSGSECARHHHSCPGLLRCVTVPHVPRAPGSEGEAGLQRHGPQAGCSQ